MVSEVKQTFYAFKKYADLDQIPSLYKIRGYFSYWNSSKKKGYSGVAVYSQINRSCATGWGSRFDDESNDSARFPDWVLNNVFFKWRARKIV